MSEHSQSYLDVLNARLDEQERQEAMPVAEPEKEQQSFGGDMVDAFQKGAYQGLAGMGETAEQLTGFGEDFRDWAQDGADTQDDTMSDVGLASMQKQIFKGDGQGGVEFGEGASDWRTWSLQLSSTIGQYADMALGGAGLARAGLSLGAKAVGKSAAKQAAKKGASKEQAEALGKQAMDGFIKGQGSNASVISYGLVGGGMAQGQSAIEARDFTMDMTDAEMDTSEQFSKVFYSLYDANPSSDPEVITAYRLQAKKHLAEEAADAVFRDPALLATNILGELVGGKLLDGVLRGVGSGSRRINAARGFAQEGATEAAQGGMEKYSVNKAIQENVHQDQALMEGVAAGALNEAAMGGAIGGMMGAARKGTPNQSELSPHEPQVDSPESPPQAPPQAPPADPFAAAGPEKASEEREDIAAQLREERGDFSGIDQDIFVAEKQGFEEQAVRLRAAKRNFEMAQDFMEEGNETASMRFRERGMKIYKDIMGDDGGSEAEVPSGGLPAEYVSGGEVLESVDLPSVEVKQPNIYGQEAEPHAVAAPTQQLPDLHVRDEIHIPAQDATQIHGNANNGMEGQPRVIGQTPANSEPVQEVPMRALPDLHVRDEIHVPAQDSSQIHGNANNGLEGRPRVIGRAPIRYKAVAKGGVTAPVAPIEGGLSLQPKDQDHFDSVEMGSIMDGLAGNVESEIDDHVDARRREQISQGLENDPRVLREPFRQRLAVTSSELRQGKKSGRRLDVEVDSLLDAIAKLGGIDTQEAVAEGLDPADTVTISKGQFAKTFRVSGGQTLDSMAESLSQYGYVSPDYTKNELLDKITNAVAGHDEFSLYKNHEQNDYLDWYADAPKEVVGLGRQGVAMALDTALKGNKLGARQARAVKHVMDLESNDRQARFEREVRPLRDKIIKMRKYQAQIANNENPTISDNPAYTVIENNYSAEDLALDNVAMAGIVSAARKQGLSLDQVNSALYKSEGDPVEFGYLIDQALYDQAVDNESLQDGLSDVVLNENTGHLFGGEHGHDGAGLDSGREALGRSGEEDNGQYESDSGGVGQGGAARTEAPASQVKPEPGLLATYSEKDLAEKERVNQEEQASIKAAEDKAKVDDDVGGFVLAGSGLEADKAMAQGQGSLLGEPTSAQKEAGNYKKKHVRIHGLEISIENQAGTVRSGTDEEGNDWSNEIHHDYGDIKGTTGADGDAIDVFIGKNLTGQKVFVVNQTHGNGEFDEHKVMLGFNSKEQAEAGYLKNYDEGWDNFTSTIGVNVGDFKTWLRIGDTSKPFSVGLNDGTKENSQNQIKDEQDVYEKYDNTERPTGHISEREPSDRQLPLELLGDLHASGEVSGKQFVESAKDSYSVTVRHQTAQTLKVGTEHVTTPQEAAHVVAAIRKHAQETFMAIVTDSNHRVLEVIRHTKGNKDNSSVDVGEFLGSIASVDGAAHYWLAHNHPSGTQASSDADRRVTKKIDILSDGSGLDYQGHVILTGQRNAVFFKGNASRDASIKVKPLIRKKSVSVTERVFVKRGTSGENISSPSSAIKAIESVESDNAVILLNVANAPIGSISIDSFDGGRLRKTGGLNHLLKAIGKSNVAAVIIKNKHMSDKADASARNLVRFFKSAQVRVLDHFHYDNGWRSDAQHKGFGDSIIDEDGAFAKLVDAGTPTKGTGKGQVSAWVADIESELGEKITVVQHQDDLPKAARDKFSGRVRGVYHEGKMYLVADNIQDKEMAIETALHEVLGHYGVMNFLGENLDSTIDEIFKSLGKRPFKDIAAQYQLDLNAKEGRREAVLEHIAHIAETGKRPSLVHKIISAIRNALRNLFPFVPWTDTDILVLIERSRVAMTNGRSVKVDLAESLASIEANHFRRDLSKAMASKKTLVQPLSLGKTPLVFQALGAKALPLTITRDTVRKIVNGVKHDVPMSVIEQLPELLSKPVAIFDGSKPDSLLALIDAKDDAGNPVVVAVHLAKQGAQYKVNKIASAYGKESFGVFRKSRLRYLDKQQNPELLRLIQLQLPRSRVTQGLDQNILTPSDLVKGNGDTLASLDGTMDAPPAGKPAKFGDQTSKHFDDLNQDQADFLDNIAPPTIKQAAIERIKAVMDNWRLKVRQGLVDRYAALLKMDTELHGENVIKDDTQLSSWAKSRLSSTASGVVSALMNGGRVYYDKDSGVMDVKEGTQGLVHVLNKLGSAAEVERFMGWIAANRSQRLAEEGKENLFSDAQIKAGIELDGGSTVDGRARKALYAKTLQDFELYRDDVLAIAEEAGVISGETRGMWMDEFYVPFYRVMEDMDTFKGPVAAGGLTRQQATKKLKGGSQKLGELLQNTLMNYHHLIDASLKNLAARQAIDNAVKMGIAKKIPKALSTKNKKATFVLKDGQEHWYEISDAMVFSAVTSLSSTGMNGGAMKVMRAFKRTFTQFTTASPQFMVANLLRDTLHAVGVANLSGNVAGNVVGGLKSYLNDAERARMDATGASFSFGHVYGEDAESIKWNINKQLKGAKVIESPKDAIGLIGRAWQAYTGMGDKLENANRASVFKQNEKRGKMYAALEARDLMAFDAHGAWPAIRILIDVVPFMNARLQGLDKMYRAGVKPTTNVIRHMMGIEDASVSDKQAAARFMAVVGSLSLASIALYLHNQDDEEYQKLEDWQKDTYWYFRVNDNAFFMPKPFEIGAIATLFERVTEQAVDDKATGKLFAERLGHMLSDTFSFSPVPQIAQPLIDVYSNKDAFTKRDIESASMQRLSPAMRSRASTTEIAKSLSTGLEGTLGSLLGKDSTLVLSPVQIDHLIGGYFGWLGTTATATADAGVKRAVGITNPEKDWYEYQPFRRFYRNLKLPGYTKVQSQFYDRLREVGQVYSDVQELRKLGRIDEARALQKENKEMLSQRKMLNNLQRQMGKINRRLKLAMASDNSAEWKRRESDRLKVMKNKYMARIRDHVN